MRVLDLSTVVMVPWATQIFGDLGADVISVETSAGNIARTMTAGPCDGLSGLALNLLRNKRSIQLDLALEDDREALLRIIDDTDVFATNLRSGSLARSGLSYPELAARNPRLIYCQAAGFPSDSPRADDPAYDDIIQSAAGIADLFVRSTGRAGYAPMALADKIGSLTVAYAVMAALFDRERSGCGQLIEVPMIDAVQAFTMVEHLAGATGVPGQGPAGYPRVLAPHRRPQRTTDGWVTVLPYSEKNWRDFFVAVGRAALADERITSTAQRTKHADALYADLEPIIAEEASEFWRGLCSRLSIPFAAVQSLDDLAAALPEADHPIAGRYKVLPQPVRFHGRRDDDVVRRPAPLPGQHTDEVLAALTTSTPMNDADAAGFLVNAERRVRRRTTLWSLESSGARGCRPVLGEQHGC